MARGNGHGVCLPVTQEAMLATVTTIPWLFSTKLGRNSWIIQ